VVIDLSNVMPAILARAEPGQPIDTGEAGRLR
jgi:hypothetical protein